ncbi:MAG: peptidylprolyl isomerase [Leptolyngbyaceae cyanobacterium CRU_2_3]|nr:peptidylprolyl isomerase [Leptolyngbyaceae cyanobacterium CRU_2_3]
MAEVMTISHDEILYQLKLSCLIPSTVEGVVTRKVITRIAAEQGIQAELSELQQAADGLRLLNKLQSANDTWLWLQKHNLSLDEFEELVQTTVISSKLANHLFDAQVEPFFVEHQLDYAQAVMYEVVLEDADLAMELFYSIQEGEISFHEVSHQYIQDLELRRCGGYRGPLARTDLKPEISAAVFAATPPQLLKPLITSKGSHLILVEELIQPELNESLRYKILSDLFLAWLKQQVDQVDTVVLQETTEDTRLLSIRS